MPDQTTLDHLNKMLEDKDQQTLTLTRWQIIRRWEMGIYNDVAYLSHILDFELQHKWRDRLERTDSSAHPFKLELTGGDYDYLMREWRGVTLKNDDGDVKELTVDKLSKALATLHAKEGLMAFTRQLTLWLDAEADFGNLKPSEAHHEDA